jgi:RNA polymerase sigma factor (sigma-70 family)
MASSIGPNGKNGPSQQSRARQADAEQAVRAVAQLRQLREEPEEFVERLSSFVGYELGRRIEMGQLAPNDLLRDEVVDIAMASALARLEAGTPIRDLHTYLRTRAQETMRREVRRVGFERQRIVSLDQVVNNDDDGSDEEVRLADIIPDLNARELDQASIDAETLAYLIDALSDLPERWRTIFLERTVQGHSVRYIADSEQLDPDEVRRIVITCRDFLRDRMENVYFALDADDF